MHYSYIAAWSVVGGFSLPSGIQAIDLHQTDNCRFLLTRDPDAHLTLIDRGRAIGLLMLKPCFQGETGDPVTRLKVESERIKI
jgi:hypothetical protein